MTAHLEEGHRLLRFMRDHAPEDCRDSMIENVPLHRDIMKAWEEHGVGGGWSDPSRRRGTYANLGAAE